MKTRPKSETTQRSVGEAPACYVYGIVRDDARLPGDMDGVAGEEVSLVRHGGLAGLVSEISPGQALGTREDLLAHEGVVEAVAADTTVLPLRFGSVVTTADALVEEMLIPYHDWFETVLDDLEGTHEFAVVGVYVEDAVLREVIGEDPEAAQLRNRIRELPEDAAYYDRIRLGELIVKALDEKRQVDSEALVRALEPLSEAVSLRTPTSEDTAADAAFLVTDRDLPAFEDAVDELGERWAGRVRLRMIGPLAPYDFVPAPPEEGT
ncbi:GvpL/GvpF family gas vesicle protein [Actinoallomurus bryophytorum]|uniref:Gas vesicle protein GvpL/GvpF n=1 Tax=Actinoallomurus bryophytorum TaxID=1490222 RepID=A0A543CPS1_9ACTN|nr:GvpL/GvpF family gas vesicle protein [Actinoallomurus bryophytorum]TQL98970.1 gas vesicle protein GvpL/GvpF [Actinoallomurus bryophytorum]